MSLFSDLNEVLTPYAQRIKGLVTAKDEILTDLEKKAPVIVNAYDEAGVVTFNDGADDMPMKSLVLKLVPYQEGSGNPSPDNVRPIRGYTNINVWQNASLSEIGVIDYSIDLPQTVYGGVLDAVNGVLRVTHGMVKITGSESNLPTSSGSVSGSIIVRKEIDSIPHGEKVKVGLIADYLPETTAYTSWRSATPSVATTEDGKTLWMRLPNVASSSAARSYLSEHPLTVIYPLATPIEIAIDPIIVKTLFGSNTIWMDAAGTIQCDYPVDTKTHIDAITEEMDNRVAALEFNSGITPAVKNAILACFANVAWKDEDSGPNYYRDLAEALYPTSELESITAVYEQSGGVYVDTPLNDLKSDLVVTAHYANEITSIVPASLYTLTGTLAVGATTVSVSYGGKSTTFSVAVTAPLYPFENGTHNFTNPASQVVVSNGNAAVITASTDNDNSTHANISEPTGNTAACNATANYTVSEPYFTIPAGSTLRCKATITNLVYPTNTSNAALAFRNMSGTAVLIMFANYNLSNMTIGQEFSESITVESATDIGCVGLYLGRGGNSDACKIGVKIEAYLDDVRII